MTDTPRDPLTVACGGCGYNVTNTHNGWRAHLQLHPAHLASTLADTPSPADPLTALRLKVEAILNQYDNRQLLRREAATKLVATLAAARPTDDAALRARLLDLQDWLIHPDRAYSPHEIAMYAHDRIAAALGGSHG